ncbi:hypothetical protein Tco_0473894 [Tanacetum coccineum]
MKSVSLKQRLAGKKSLKKKWMQKESVSKQGRKFAKAEPIVHKDKAFDELDDDEIDNMETEDAQEMRRTRYVVHEEKERKLVLKMHLVPTRKKIVPTDQIKVLTSKKLLPTRKKIVLIDQMKVLLIKLKEEVLLLIKSKEKVLLQNKLPTTKYSYIIGDDETILLKFFYT